MKDSVIVQDEGLPHRKMYRLSMRAHKAYRLIFFGLGVVEALLGIRFFFKLAGANPASSFVSFLYGFTGVLLWPFSGVFPGNAAQGPGVGRIFEPTTLVACAIYVLVAFGISRLLLIAYSEPLDGKD